MTYKTGGWGSQAKAQSKLTRRKYRALALESLGGKCVRCGFDDPRALQIDHINGGGSKERKGAKNGNYKALKEVIKGNKENKYQLLCSNCNWIKRWENKEIRKGRK